MMPPHFRWVPLLTVVVLFLLSLLMTKHAAVAALERAEAQPVVAAFSPEVWRQEKRIIDMHMHIEGVPERFERAVKIMDGAGIGVGVVLGAGTVTPKDGGPSEFERVKALADAKFPRRFVHHMLLDYAGWESPDWSEKAVRQLERGRELGAAGLKEFKRLGLFLRDPLGDLIKIDDPKLDAVWQKCGELGMPVSIHVADPRAFWRPFDSTNERWKELKDHRNWWFGDAAKFPPLVAFFGIVGAFIIALLRNAPSLLMRMIAVVFALLGILNGAGLALAHALVDQSGVRIYYFLWPLLFLTLGAAYQSLSLSERMRRDATRRFIPVLGRVINFSSVPGS